MATTPKASWPWVKTLLHSVYDQPDAASVHAQYDRLVDAIAEKLPKVCGTPAAPQLRSQPSSNPGGVEAMKLIAE
jgi:transposase-like protein